MAVRDFPDAGTNYVKLSIGGFSAVQYGTFAAIIKPAATTAPDRTVLAFLNSGGAFVSTPLQMTNTNLYWFATSQSGGPAVSDGTWYLVVARKSSGTAGVRWSLYNFSTGTWAHSVGSTPQPDWTTPGAGGFINTATSSTDGESFTGRLAMSAGWANQVKWAADTTGDAQIEAAGLEDSVSAWVTAAPTGLWKWDVSVAAGITDSVGSANQVAISGTAQVIGDDPPGFTGLTDPANVTRVAVTTGAPGAVTAFAPTLPTHATDDRMILAVVGKYNTTTIPTINQGWTLVGSGTGGTGSAANDTGQTFWAVYAKDATSSSETAPTVTPGGTAPNSWEWICATHRHAAGKTWADAIGASAAWVQSASDTSTSSPLTGTAGAWTGVQPTADDAIFAVGVIPTDLGTALGATTLTATGLSGGIKTTATSQYVENALGTDTAAVWAGWTEFTGTASAGLAMSFTVTGATNQSGSLIAVALRQQSGSFSGSAAPSWAATITAAGSIEPPAGVTDLALWWAAEDLTGLSDGAAVGTSGVSPWASRVGSSVGLQTTSGKRPTKQTVSSKQLVRFDGSDDILMLDGDALNVLRNLSGATVFIKAKLNTVPPSTWEFFFHMSNNAGLTVTRFNSDVAPSGTLEQGGRRTDAGGHTEIQAGTVGTSLVRVLTTVLDYTNADLFSYMDGVQQGQNLTSWGGGGTSDNTASLGAAFGGEASDSNARYLAFDLYEVLIYQRVLNSTERGQIETYLGVSAGSFSGSAAPSWAATITAAGNMSAAGAASRSTTATIASSGRGEGSASPTWTATITAAGALSTSGAASLSETATITAAGQTQGSASRSTTANVTAAGNMSAAGAASLTGTAAITPSGRAEGSASPAWNAAITAAGGLGALGGSANVSAAAAITSSGQVQGASSSTWAASITAAGVLTTSGSAAVSETASITTSGRAQGTSALTEAAVITGVGAGQGVVAVAETASIASSGRAQGSSSPAWNAAITAAGGPPGTGVASVNAVATIVAAGVLTASGSAARNTTADIAAAGQALGSASRSTTVSVSSSGQVQGSAALAETANISASGRGQGSASPAWAANLASSGRVEGGTAAQDWSATITAVGNVSGGAVSGSASLNVTASITAAGILTASGQASVSITASRTATGQPQGSAARSTTASVTAAARAEGQAGVAATATITAVGRLSLSGSASLNAVATIFAAGVASGVGILPAAPTRVDTGHQMSRVETGHEMSGVRTGSVQSRVETEGQMTRVDTESQMSRVSSELG